MTIDISKFKKKKTALVLSGGVVKGAAWHLGVAQALTQLGFTLKHNNSDPNADYEISTYVGSSAGAMTNLLFASGFHPADIIHAMASPKQKKGKKVKNKFRPITYRDILYLKRPSKTPKKGDYLSPFKSIPLYKKIILKPFVGTSGLFSTHGLYNYIKKNIIQFDKFEDFVADMFVVATKLDHSQKVIFGKYDSLKTSSFVSKYKVGKSVAECVAASMSVPPFFVPYPIKNHDSGKADYYIDGEIRDTLSTHIAFDNGCKVAISSWTHTPYHFQEKIGSLVNYGLPAICLQSILLMIQKKIIMARSRRKMIKGAIESVNKYMKSEKFSLSQRKQLMAILEKKLHYNPKLQYIDIYPKDSDYEVFFQNSFSLDPNKTAHLVNSAYKRTIEVFRNQEWLH